MIGVLNYSAGNVTSVINALNRLEVDCLLVDELEKLHLVDGLIIPGVGAFGWATGQMAKMGLTRDLLVEFAASRKVLGICLGMQVLYDYGLEEGYAEGLGIINGGVERFSGKLMVPHMGWNRVDVVCDSPLTLGIAEGFDAYFAHSYKVVSQGTEVLGTTSYGVGFPSIVRQGNFYGVQFHPEKSGGVGLKMLMNFKEMCDENNSGNGFKIR